MPGQFQSALDNLPRSQFGSIIFPVARHRLRATQRKHIHEFPHRDGGAPEKLGRSLYTITLQAPFHRDLEQFPDLYPRSINDLQVLFEQGKTQKFVYPTVGSFDAFISAWDRQSDARVRSGELVEMELTEDQSSDFLTTEILDSAHFAAFGSTADEVAAQLASLQAQLIPSADATATVAIPPEQIAAKVDFSANDLGLFDSLQALANDITGISDTADLFSNLVQTKVQQLANICGQIDQSLSLQDARSFNLLEAVHNLWGLCTRVLNDSQQQRVSIQQWIVPISMPITMVATRLYGNASRADDLLALNDIPNPQSVRAGTTINYYPAT